MNDKKEEVYREGCDESKEAPEENVVSLAKENLDEPDPENAKPQEEPQPENEQEVVPDTAFLIIRHTDGRVEATTTLPGFQMQRQAGLRDLRDISHSLYLDVCTTMNGRVTAHEAANSLQQAMVKQQISKIAQGMKK